MDTSSSQSSQPVDVQSLRIVHYPAPVLRKKALAIETVTDEIRAIAAKMIELMHEAPGVGLAAPQVGLSLRMFVANPTGEPDDDLVFINPALSNPSRQTEDHDEGCLSLPGVNARIRRPVGITITATDPAGETFTMSCNELPARIWQHEYDHLEGILILDKMNMLDRKANKRAIEELERGG